MKYIIIISMLFLTCSVQTVSFDKAPKAYIVEKKRVRKLDKDFSFYYCRSLITGNYLLTAEMKTYAAEVGDTLLLGNYYGFFYIKKKSGKH